MEVERSWLPPAHVCHGDRHRHAPTRTETMRTVIALILPADNHCHCWFQWRFAADLASFLRPVERQSYSSCLCGFPACQDSSWYTSALSVNLLMGSYHRRFCLRLIVRLSYSSLFDLSQHCSLVQRHTVPYTDSRCRATSQTRVWNSINISGSTVAEPWITKAKTI
jgi:hypothetical protein